MQRILRASALFLVCACSTAVPPAFAAHSNSVISSHDTATLITDREAVGPDQTLKVGLRLQLKPGWHTYWVNPGDAGDAPKLTVSAQGGQKGQSSQIEWPVPVRLSEGGLMAYAYLGDVLLPETLALKGAGPVELRAHAEWLVCAETCVPESGDFTLTLPSATAGRADGPDAERFRQAEAARPVPSPFRARLSPQGTLSLEGEGLSPAAIAQAWFLPLEGGVLEQKAEQPLQVEDGRLTLALKADRIAGSAVWHRPLEGVVVLKDPAGKQSALQVTARPVPASETPAFRSVEGRSVESRFAVGKSLQLLAFAFIGGLILNLMPCVFPVLAMKSLSLMRMGGTGQKARILSGIVYSAGVVGSFVALGLLMIGLRLAGSAVGWGFQFQSSGFVIGVCWLLFLLALNMLGVFQITLGRVGQGRVSAGLGGDFMVGALAVIVATPCTAPFMGVAIAGALGGSWIVGALVFLCMGLGLAAPYVLISCVPAVGRYLPKPGEWMEVLKQFLAFPLLATCVWLLWVAGLQRGMTLVVVTAGGAVLLGFAAWLYGLAQHRAMREGGDKIITFCRLTALLCAAACVAALVYGLQQTTLSSPPRAGGDSLVFSEARLAELRAKGRPVFIDMTASWCITCLVNERVALQNPAVEAAFAARRVAYLKGDWTSRDSVISAYLKAHGRDGVPLYVYYPPHEEGKVLPQILTPKIVLEFLSR